MKYNNETKQKEVYTNGALLKEDFSSYLYKTSRAGDANNTSAVYALYNDLENYKRIEILSIFLIQKMVVQTKKKNNTL